MKQERIAEATKQKHAEQHEWASENKTKNTCFLSFIKLCSSSSRVILLYPSKTWTAYLSVIFKCSSSIHPSIYLSVSVRLENVNDRTQRNTLERVLRSISCLLATATGRRKRIFRCFIQFRKSLAAKLSLSFWALIRLPAILIRLRINAVEIIETSKV